MRLSLRLLGPFEATLDGQPVRGFESDKARALLAYLALEAGRPQRREALAELLWPERPTELSLSNLRSTLSRLRQAICDHQATPPFLITTHGTITLNPDSDYACDADDLTRAVAAADEGEADEERLSLAVAGYRGRFCEGLSGGDCEELEQWLLTRQSHFERLYLRALAHLAHRHEARGRPQQAIACLRRALELEPWAEETRRELMRLLVLTGERGAALAQYEACRRALAEELGAEPSAQTVALHEAIRSGALPTPPAATAPPPEALETPLPQLEPPVQRPVVGREAELGLLAAHLQEVTAGRGRVVFVVGEPGSGKTMLMQEFARRAAADERLLVVGGSCDAYAGVGDPFLPFIQMLQTLCLQAEPAQAGLPASPAYLQRLRSAAPHCARAVAQRGPDLVGGFVEGPPLAALLRALPDGAGLAARIDQAGQTGAARMVSTQPAPVMEQYAQVLVAIARHRPLLLIVDDLHWADNGSIGLLAHIGRHLTTSPILLLGAYRPGELARGRGEGRHPLEAVVDELGALTGLEALDLAQADGRAFIDSLLDLEPNRLGEPFRRALHERTEGHALFTVEVLRGLRERGGLVQDGAGLWVEAAPPQWQELPLRLEAAIEERLGHLEEEWRRTLEVASVAGEEFYAEAVAAAAGVEEGEVIRRLSGPLSRRHRLVVARGRQRLARGPVSQYRFRHYLFQAHLYNSLDPVERAHLHERMGRALEGLFGEGTGDVAAQLAWHFEEAGLAGEAIGYLQRAGERALRLGAYEEAASLLRRGLALVEGLADSAERTRRERDLQAGLRVALEAVAGPLAAETLQAYRRTLELSGQVREAPLSHEAATHLVAEHMTWAFYSRALDVWNEHMGPVVAGDDPVLALVAYFQRGSILHYLGRLVEARADYERCLALYRPEHHPRLVSLYVIDPGPLCRVQWAGLLCALGYPDQGRRQSRQAVAEAEALGHGRTLVACLRRICALDYTLHRDAEAVRGWLQRVAAVESERELPNLQHWLRVFEAWLRALAGEAEGVEEMLRLLDPEESLRTGDLGERPNYLLRLAEACVQAGRVEEGLRAMALAQAQVGRTGTGLFGPWADCVQAELLLQRGGPGDVDEAKACLRRAIERARSQGAVWWELQAATVLGRMAAGEGSGEEARELVAAAYARFHEGFDTVVLQEARSLLDQLAAPQPLPAGRARQPAPASRRRPLVTIGSVWGDWFSMYGARVIHHRTIFLESLAGIEQQEGVEIQYRYGDFSIPPFLDELESGTGPDIVEFMFPAVSLDLARKGKVVDLAAFADMEQLRSRYDQLWLDWGTGMGPQGPVLTGVFNMFFLKAVVWYPKAAFEEAGYLVPASWDELIALSDRIVRDGGTPWAIADSVWGSETGGMPAARWIQELLLRTAGPEDYERWIRGELPFCSSQVKRAVELMSQVWFTPGYAYGGREGITSLRLGTEVTQLLAGRPPRAWLMSEPSWASFFLPEEAEFGRDYAFFNLPPVDPAHGAPAMLEGHFVSMFRDRPEVRAVMEHFISGAQAEAWTEAGRRRLAFNSVCPRRGMAPRPDDTPAERAVLDLLARADGVCFSAAELMPLVVMRRFCRSMYDYVGGAVDLDTALRRVDDAWPR